MREVEKAEAAKGAQEERQACVRHALLSARPATHWCRGWRGAAGSWGLFLAALCVATAQHAGAKESLPCTTFQSQLHTHARAPAAATTRPGTANRRRPEARSTYTPRVDGDHLVDVVGHGYHDELGNLLPRYCNRPGYAGCRNHAFVPGFEQESAWL